MAQSFLWALIACPALMLAFRAGAQTVPRPPYPIVDTGQTQTYDNTTAIAPPVKGQPFYGQDAQHTGNQPRYKDNGNGTVTDRVTGLMWAKSPDLNHDGVIDALDKRTYAQALAGAKAFRLGGYSDWRLPTLKQLYSLIDFRGTDPSGQVNGSGLTPFINTAYFGFGYGDRSAGDRVIDAQYATSTQYVSTTMNGARTMFGVNFADGRIKGYPTGATPRHQDGKTFYVLYVRGNILYGFNDFVDNGNGTITDRATGLMWSKADSGRGMNWEQALAWVQQKNAENYLGHDDWRLPNAKELQSIVDDSRSPDTSDSAAISPFFEVTPITNEGGQPDFPWYWTSTTHAGLHGNGRAAVYIAFGRALGWMGPHRRGRLGMHRMNRQEPGTGGPGLGGGMPPPQDRFGRPESMDGPGPGMGSGQRPMQRSGRQGHRRPGCVRLMDVHGAGAQRSDPKSGSPKDFYMGKSCDGRDAYGRGPQGDVIRIDNFVRLVRDAPPAEKR
ncbi:MAG: DUF1566 domain-containing protein [Acidobacteriota bacterium]